MIVTYIMTSRDRQKVYRDRLKLVADETNHFISLGLVRGGRIDLDNPRSRKFENTEHRNCVYLLRWTHFWVM